MLKEFVKVKKNIQEKKENFEEWKKVNFVSEVNVNKQLEKNRKLIALKWL